MDALEKQEEKKKSRQLHFILNFQVHIVVLYACSKYQDLYKRIPKCNGKKGWQVFWLPLFLHQLK
jgi:hypothetical protein